MSNPQINSLKSAETLTIVQDDIVEILIKYSKKDKPLCSHEILGLASCNTIIAIAQLISPNEGGFSIPSSWIGSVAADMANSNLITTKEKWCPYNHHNDSAWYIE